MPQPSIDAAKAAVAAAQNAKAGQYALAEFNQAESLLKNAITQQQMNNAFQAKAFANQAKGKAEAALRIAQQKASTPPPVAGPQPTTTTPPKATTQTPPPSGASTQKPKGNKK